MIAIRSRVVAGSRDVQLASLFDLCRGTAWRMFGSVIGFWCFDSRNMCCCTWAEARSPVRRTTRCRSRGTAQVTAQAWHLLRDVVVARLHKGSRRGGKKLQMDYHQTASPLPFSSSFSNQKVHRCAFLLCYLSSILWFQFSGSLWSSETEITLILSWIGDWIDNVVSKPSTVLNLSYFPDVAKNLVSMKAMFIYADNTRHRITGCNHLQFHWQ